MDYESPYLDGRQFGMPKSCRVHRLANIACQIHAGENCRIDAFVTVTGNVTLGQGVHLSTGSLISGGFDCYMGDWSALSPGAKIFTATDDIESGLLASFEGSGIERAMKVRPVFVGRYTPIGANSVVLPGVAIGERCQIGALSLVTKDVPSGWIYAGVPARPVRPRPPLKYIDAPLSYDNGGC